MTSITELHPQKIWQYFVDICKIPRPSKHEEKIIEYIVQFGKELQLETLTDKAGNIVIRKPATPGYEHLSPIVLQSHLDMVCEKNSQTEHDFYNDAITPVILDGWVKAKGTTLGADDGIGIAAQLAILASDNIAHGALECLFTVDEETGLSGANALKPGFFKGQTLINLDSEDEGELYIGCAGGIDTQAYFDVHKEPASSDTIAVKISIEGLTGGHSGDDINKGLGNANKILARFIQIAASEHNFRVSSIDGGNLRNAIAREAYAIGTIPTNEKEPIRIAYNLFAHDISMELKQTEPKMKLILGSTDKADFVWEPNFQSRFINALLGCPHGVIEMSRSITDLVETSTNLASIKMDGDKVIVTTSQRSSVESAKHYAAKMVASIFELAGATIKHSDGYPGWTPNISSPLLKVTEQLYLELFNEKPKVKAIHAGLECGLFLEKYPGLDMISFGPTIKGAHSPDERLNIESVDRFWQLLIKLIGTKIN